MKKKTFKASRVALMFSVVFASGCSSYVTSNATPLDQATYEFSETKMMDVEHADVVLNQISEDQNQRLLNAWEEGPRTSDRLAAAITGKELSTETWKPEIKPIKIEEDTKSYYTLVKKLGSLFYATPATTLANDEVILVSIPNDWLWGRSFSDISFASEAYLERFYQTLEDQAIRVNVRSYTNSKKISVVGSSLAQTRAEKIAELITLNTGKNSQHIPGTGYANAVIDNELIDNSTLIEIRPTNQISSEKYLEEDKGLSWVKNQ